MISVVLVLHLNEDRDRKDLVIFIAEIIAMICERKKLTNKRTEQRMIKPIKRRRSKAKKRTIEINELDKLQ